jgi:hypothetical protein
MSSTASRPDESLQFSRIGAIFLLIAVLGIWVSLRSLRYYLPEIPFPAPLFNVKNHFHMILMHGTSGAIALFIGAWQFMAPLRKRHPVVHRVAGRIYVVAACFSAVMSLLLSVHATTGLVASIGFMLLGVGWFSTTLFAFRAILRRQILTHQLWMLRSYALIFSAVTLRFYVPLSKMLHIPFLTAYPSIAWLCWLPNLMFAEWLIRRASSLPARSSHASHSLHS